MRDADVRLDAVLDPLDAEGGGGSSIATVAIVPVAKPAEEPQIGQAFDLSVNSDLQVMQRSIFLYSVVPEFPRTDRPPEAVTHHAHQKCHRRQTIGRVPGTQMGID